jgi:hypothetical protein
MHSNIHAVSQQILLQTLGSVCFMRSTMCSPDFNLQRRASSRARRDGGRFRQA